MQGQLYILSSFRCCPSCSGTLVSRSPLRLNFLCELCVYVICALMCASRTEKKYIFFLRCIWHHSILRAFSFGEGVKQGCKKKKKKKKKKNQNKIMIFNFVCGETFNFFFFYFDWLTFSFSSVEFSTNDSCRKSHSASLYTTFKKWRGKEKQETKTKQKKQSPRCWQIRSQNFLYSLCFSLHNTTHQLLSNHTRIHNTHTQNRWSFVRDRCFVWILSQYSPRNVVEETHTLVITPHSKKLRARGPRDWLNAKCILIRDMLCLFYRTHTHIHMLKK